MSVFPKFIIEKDPELGNVLIIAKCTYHKQLATIPENILGGGWWTLNRETETFTLNGDSHDYGRASVEDIKDCIDRDMVFTNSSCMHSIVSKWNFKYMDQCGGITELKMK